MGRQQVYQRYATKTLVVKVKEDKEVYKKMKSEGKEIFCALTFIIKEPKVEEVISKYLYIFNEEVSLNDINSFIKNFLEDKEFRKKNAILIEGIECDEIFDFVNSEGTNIECYNQITNLNKQKEVNKVDLMNLRTNGMDKYSSMSLDIIEEFIDTSIMKKFYKELKNNSQVLKACRWYMRGLKQELCIRKVKLDLTLNKDKK